MPRWLSIGGRLTFSLIFSNPRVASHPASHFCSRGRARAIWKSQHPTLAEPHTTCTYLHGK
jgi:hypothetical protein